MIIVNISGSLPQQLGQYAFGLACALYPGVGMEVGFISKPSLLDTAIGLCKQGTRSI
jgi:hypothetical protein